MLSQRWVSRSMSAVVRRERQVTKLMKHDRVLVEQPVGQAPGAALALFGIELIDPIDDATVWSWRICVSLTVDSLKSKLSRSRGIGKLASRRW
jgi:hypothetical protein